MSSQYILMGTNIVCTNMTKPTPLKIGTPSRICSAISHDDKPILRIVDCKISDCFCCRVPMMKWGGLMTFLVGVAMGAVIVAGVIAVAAATVATGGLAGGIVAGIGAAIVPAAEGALTAALAIGCATFVGSSIKLGYDTSHLCDVSMDSTWKIAQPDTIIEGEQAILSHSFFSCSQGGVVTPIIDDGLASRAARMIADNNSSIISEEMKNQLIQGCIGGLTGAANPVSLAITATLAIGDGIKGYDDFYIDQFDMLKTDSEFKYDYEGETEEIAETTVSGEIIQEGGHRISPQKMDGGTVSSTMEAGNGMKETQKISEVASRASQKAEENAVRRMEKLSNNSSKKMKGRATGARQKANHANKVAGQAARDAQYAKGKIVGGIIGFGLSVGGSFVSMFVDSKYKNKEFNMAQDEIIPIIKETHTLDVNKSQIISDEI
ncbi:hypothetical protein [Prevotella sp. KH2C16]|uniref:hypothetical protein n=1 Tax=Prevotella sp. KH2C16 TaxID=1855325 RepID=UPI0008DFAB0E|nr:hypothetical protein [Prevotella sp. KH2C16]SFG46624.1 hypothetical protein SAMN05216383_11554 [Prevotella sp. KH2C16]